MLVRQRLRVLAGPLNSTIILIILPHPRLTSRLSYLTTLYSTFYHRVPAYRVEMKQDECNCPLSRSVHCNFVSDDKYSEGGGREPPIHPHQLGLIFPSWGNVRQKAADAALCVLYATHLLCVYCSRWWGQLCWGGPGPRRPARQPARRPLPSQEARPARRPAPALLLLLTTTRLLAGPLHAGEQVGPEAAVGGPELLWIVRRLAEGFEDGADRLDQQLPDVLGGNLLHAGGGQVVRVQGCSSSSTLSEYSSR